MSTRFRRRLCAGTIVPPSLCESVAMTNSLLAFMMPGPFEMMIIGVIILLLFGNRLPRLMRSAGRSVVEFKKGVQGIEDDIEQAELPADDKKDE